MTKNINKSNKQWLRRHPGEPLPVRAGRKCKYCGVNIDHRDIRSKHCSSRCRDRDYAGLSIGKESECEHCGGAFTKRKSPQRFCSKRCRDRADLIRNRADYNARNAKRRAMERAAVVGEPFEAIDVFERDGWICQLCLTPINPMYKGRHPLAPSIDHIVPLNRGGEHSFDNVWAAHCSCNSSKRDHYSEFQIFATPLSRGHVGDGRTWR